MHRRRAALLGIVVLALSVPAFAGASARPHGTVGGPPGLDHFLCYQAKALTADPWETLAKKVTLVDQFGQATVKIPKFPTRLCNPVDKIIPGAEFPPQNPNAHLVCWKIKEPLNPPREVNVQNQFGQARLTVGQPKGLCLPSWKSLTEQLPSEPAPPGLDHFKCYDAAYSTKVVQHFKIPPQVQLIDQFQNFQTKIKLPVTLCNPVNKILKGGQSFPPQNPQAHLVCFALPNPTHPVTAHVWVKNQFGIGQLDVVKDDELCLPSFKQLVPNG
jgi:hypothetical protein